MRNIIIASGGIELLLVIAASLIAGPGAISAMRTIGLRCANVAIVGVLAVTCWVAAGLAINRAVLLLPGDGQFVTGPLLISDVAFNLNVLTPMALVTAGVAYLFGRAAAAAARGLRLRDALGLSLNPPASAHDDPADGHQMPGAFMGAGDVSAAVEDSDADLVGARR